MLEQIVSRAPVFLLVAVRCFAFVMSLPFFSSRTFPRIVKVALAGYMAYLIFPHVDFSAYTPYIRILDGGETDFSLEYVLLLVGEGLIGLIIGFFVSLIFASFSSAGQFFSFQMGFSASEVYDAMNQVENPLMGQYFNLVAMLVFLQNRWAQQIFTKVVTSSFEAFNALTLVAERERMVRFLLGGLTQLFSDAFVISLPIMGTLLLISVTMGILSKAAPQMNLLSEGFPVMILTSFFILLSLLPQLCEFFTHSFSSGFEAVGRLMNEFLNSGGGS
ncbi:MAG: flagellar biosynthetic protein FliR [Treponema sp.]|nr:flagellar biosynthetic protein FliR [Treponema sp.]